MDCPLRKDLVYTIATPTFHHWKVEDRKCGLSFQSPADARAFDRGVRKAIEDLAEGTETEFTDAQSQDLISFSCSHQCMSCRVTLMNKSFSKDL